MFTRTESFTNYGVVSGRDLATVSIEDKVWTNAATGRITVSSGQLATAGFGGFGKAATTTSGTNAGTIELINSQAAFYENFTNPVGHTWSNTGTIIVDKSNLALYGYFTSDDVVNVRNTGVVSIVGLMDNTGRTFTFNAQTQSYILTDGRIKGGTLVMGGPTARLEFSSVTGGPVSKLDGVTLQGDVVLGDVGPALVQVENGLTLNGTLTLNRGRGGTRLYFKGANCLRRDDSIAPTTWWVN